MPPVLSFIGWHNSGKTTLASQVVSHLTRRGYRVGVVKSSKETGLTPDQPGSDTDVYRKSGARSVALVTPDQLLLRAEPEQFDLASLACFHFPAMDIVIAEGFKHAAAIPKIEVNHEPDGPLLRDQVEGVIALATDRQEVFGIRVFRLNQSREIADFIERHFLRTEPAPEPRAALALNGSAIPFSPALEQIFPMIARELNAFLPSEGGELELVIRLKRQRS